MIRLWILGFLAVGLVFQAVAQPVYTEAFTGSGGVSLADWNGVFDSGGSSGGLAGSFAWVWHKGNCRNLIYTDEFELDPGAWGQIEFRYGLRRYTAYGATPVTGVAVRAGGTWYVSRQTAVSTDTVFSTQTLVYDPAAAGWDTLDIAAASRGAGAAADLSGPITGFGLFSDSGNVGGDCTAEYDFFEVAAEERPDPSPDFDASGEVDFLDFSGFAAAWQTSAGHPSFESRYDLDADSDVDIRDLSMFGLWWMEGVKAAYHPVQSPRERVGFNGGWRFYRGGVSSGDPQAASFDDSGWQAVTLPHNPPKNPPHPDPLRPEWPNYSYEGVCWYRKHFTLDPEWQGRKLFIEFEAANTVSDVWVNGVHLTTHYGGYLPFTVDITAAAFYGPSGNVIAVRVDNSDNPDVPIGNAGWFNWGGIYRDVWLHVTDPLHVTDAVYADVVAGGGVFVTTPFVSESRASVEIKTHVQNEYATAKDCVVKSWLVDADLQTVARTVDEQAIPGGSDATLIQTLDVFNPLLWHPDHPHLYTVYTEVYEGDRVADTYRTRMGIRSIQFSKAEGFTINGQPLRFRGTNRLQDYPYIGYAMGNLGQRRDARRLKEAGFDYVRLSHYPHDPAFMDACDELGLLVMDAIPGFQYIGGQEFRQRSFRDMRDMIRRDRNHPCVIAWELSLNETNFDAAYAQTAAAIGHEEYPGEDCFVAGWMHDSIYDVFIATPTAGALTYDGPAPLVVSEYGHWEFGGDAGSSDVHRDPDLSSRYDGGEAAMVQQARNHQEGHDRNLGLANVCGDGLWVGIDYGPYPSGVLDPFRLPKFSYHFWRSQREPDGAAGSPMVFIANYWTETSPSEITVYSNCRQVRLYRNGQLLETRGPDSGAFTSHIPHPPFTFSGVSFQAGELRAEGLMDGQVAAGHTVRTPGAASRLHVEFDAMGDIPANGSETVFVYASIVDAAGTVLPEASNRVTFSVSGPATLVSPASVDAEAGIATAIVRFADQPGPVTVTAAAAGLTGGSANVSSY